MIIITNQATVWVLKCFRMSIRTKLTVSTLCISITKAEEKHMSQSVSGWVFGIFALVQFLFAPIAGKLVSILVYVVE